MGINYIHDTKEKLLVVVWDGTININHWQTHLLELFADPEYQKVDYQLVDLRSAMVDESITNPKIREVVNKYVVKHANEIVGMKMALIANQEWERADYVESLFSLLPIDVTIFYNLDAACSWLGINIEEVNSMISQLRLIPQDRYKHDG